MLYCYVLLVVAVSLIGADNIPEEMRIKERKAREACIPEIGVDEKLVEDCNDGKFVEDPKLKCYMQCVLKKLDLTDAAGYIDVEKLLGYFPEDIRPPYEEGIRKCDHVAHEDPCEQSFLAHKCWFETVPDVYYMV